MTLQPEIAKAVAILQAGGLVAIPTETVYGLGGDARNPAAVAKIFAVKQRPATHPLIVHLAHPEAMHDWASAVPEIALKLANAFWPGPLTLILKKRPEVLASVTAGQDTVALRIPRHPVALALLQAFGGGLVAPSANRFTRISPTTAQAVYEELGNQVEMILDGGPCAVGVESTIIDVSQAEPRILRPGMITAEALRAVIGTDIQSAAPASEIRVPGMHHLHYAPVTHTQIIPARDSRALEAFAGSSVCLSWSGLSHPAIPCVRMPSEAAAYAQVLYAALRAEDQKQYQHIVIEAVPAEAAWDAIRDRLAKASGQSSNQ